jgi:SAM-dependent methyltransferase
MTKSNTLTANTIAQNRVTSIIAGSSPQLECSVCRKPILDLSDAQCAYCGFRMLEANGIFRTLTPDREEHFKQFIHEYELVRAREGRGSSSPEYYLALPFRDLTGRNSWQWEIRGRTFRHMEKYIFPYVERAYPRGADVLDIGAGNCWLSFQIALRGHRPVAVDLLDNDTDGLGSAQHYFSRLPRPFPRFQAEMDHLPFAAGQFDVVIFNASFHYSMDYGKTLREALRCLRRPGFVIIADTPLYRRDESGKSMLDEKRAAFRQKYGFPSDSVPSCEYLTPFMLDDLAKALGLQWKILKPWYGMQWAIRPIKARILRRREPSKFFLIWARVAP